MPDFLSAILAQRQQDVAKAMRQAPLCQLEPLAREHQQHRRPFAHRLTQNRPVALIAEIKRASPSKGPLAPNLDPSTLARAYETGGAAALSVLTEPHWFKGSPEDLNKARAASTLPVLRKDFLFCEYQIWESAAMGADAVLLIVRMLDDPTLHTLFSLAQALYLDAVVEAATEEETQRACALGASLIAINARDLTTFEVDLDRAARLAPPPSPQRILIAASGINAPSEIRRLHKAGFSAFLVGETLVRSPNPADAVRSLRESSTP